MNPLIVGTVFIPYGSAALGILLARNHRSQQIVGLIGGLLAWLCSLGLLGANMVGGPQIYRMGGWPTPYGIVLVVDLLSAIFGVMATTIVLACLIYIIGCQDRSVKQRAFMPLFMSMSASLYGALFTGDIFTLFVFIELMVMSSVILVAISDNRLGLEAAIKYLLISAMGSLFLLAGIGALYATFGTLTMADIARMLGTGARPLLATAAAVLLMGAFLLKGAVFPFHFWQPDLYTTAPTPVGAMLSSVIGKVGIYGIIRMVTLLFTEEARVIEDLLIIVGLIGILVGGLSALRTYDARRLLAYSTFGQIGFILVGIGWGTAAALTAAIVYMVNHAFIKSSLLMITGNVASRTSGETARLSEISGVGKRMPLLSILYFLGGMSLAGVPPLNGFISKVALVQGGIDAESWLPLGLAVGAGILTLLYMTRTWQHIFQKEPGEGISLKPDGEGDSLLAPLMLIIICVALGLYAAPLLDMATRAVAELGDPQIYIRAVLSGSDVLVGGPLRKGASEMLFYAIMAIPMAIAWAFITSRLTWDSLLVGYVIGFIVFAGMRFRLTGFSWQRVPDQILALLTYTIVLFRDIFRSSLEVAGRALSRDMRLHTGIIAVPTQDDSDSQYLSALSAHSITITPGELVVEFGGHETLYVHCLDVEKSSPTAEAAQARRLGLLQRVLNNGRKPTSEP